MTTCGDNMGYAMRIFEKELRQKGLHTDARFAIVMPESNVCFSFLHLDTDEKARQKVDAARQRMIHICKIITERQRDIEELVKGAIPFTYTYVIGDYYNKHLITDKKFWVDEEICIQCGLCQKLCPVDDIKGTPPVWQHNGRCTNCLACYHHCPSHAIHWGNMKRGQYLLNKLLAQK
jgi:ferredoxin